MTAPTPTRCPIPQEMVLRDRTMARCAWRIASKYRGVTDLEEIIRASRLIRTSFYLSVQEHRACCEAALALGETWLAMHLAAMEREAGAEGAAI